MRPTSSRSADFGRHLDLAVDAVDHKLNVFDVEKKLHSYDVDTVAEQLRAALHHERDDLLADAEFLRSCVDGEHDHRGQVCFMCLFDSHNHVSRLWSKSFALHAAHGFEDVFEIRARLNASSVVLCVSILGICNSCFFFASFVIWVTLSRNLLLLVLTQ